MIVLKQFLVDRGIDWLLSGSDPQMAVLLWMARWEHKIGFLSTHLRGILCDRSDREDVSRKRQSPSLSCHSPAGRPWARGLLSLARFLMRITVVVPWAGYEGDVGLRMATAPRDLALSGSACHGRQLAGVETSIGDGQWEAGIALFLGRPSAWQRSVQNTSGWRKDSSLVQKVLFSHEISRLRREGFGAFLRSLLSTPISTRGPWESQRILNPNCHFF